MSYRINFFLAHISTIAVLLIPICSHATGSGRYSSSHLGAYHSYSSSGSESHSYGYAGHKSTSKGGATSTKRKSEGNFYSSYVHKSDAQATKPSTYVYKSPLVGNSTYFHDRQSSSGLGGGKRATTAPDNSLIKKKEPNKAAIEEAPHKAAKKPKPPPDPNLIKPEAPTFLPVYH